MKQEIRDYLGVPGNVIMLEPMSKNSIVTEIQGFLDIYEALGKTKLKEIPENEDKDRLRALCRALGWEVSF